MNIITEIISKDPLLMIAIVISIISLIFIIILVNFYKKIKEQQMISQIISSSEEQKSVQVKKQKPAEEGRKPVVSATAEQKVSSQDLDIVIAQLNEMSKQINLVNNHVKDLSSIVKNLQNKPATESVISEEIVTKLVNILHQLETQISSFQKSTQSSTSSVEEINKKLDNLLKLLSTILQQ
jgi:phosphate uptake regulator